MKNLTIFCLFILLVAFSPSCGVIQQGTELKSFANCDFRLESVKNTRLAGVNIQGKKSLTDLGFSDMAKVTGVIAGGTLPLTFDLNVQARNPNASLAAMNRLDWILLIDKQEMVSGVLGDRVQIAPNSMATFPVAISLDLMEVLSGKSAEALLNLAFSLAGTGSTSKITLKAKPTIVIGSSQLQYPGYINITQEFGGK